MRNTGDVLVGLLLAPRYRSDYIVITMKTRIVRIGNSRGVRLPKPLIEQAGLGEEVELRVQEGAIVIQSAVQPRAGWAAAAQRLAAEQGGAPLDEPTLTRFDRTEWQW